eukprot:SAG31_NODE_350_length_17241_cov_156.139715_6_plen_118_part_00
MRCKSAMPVDRTTLLQSLENGLNASAHSAVQLACGTAIGSYHTAGIAREAAGNHGRWPYTSHGAERTNRNATGAGRRWLATCGVQVTRKVLERLLTWHAVMGLLSSGRGAAGDDGRE